MFQTRASEWQISVEVERDSKVLTDSAMKPVSILILLNTTGDLYSPSEQLAMQHFVRSGGSVLAIHAAADAAYSWDWYGAMLGGRFDSHPAIQEAMCLAAPDSNVSTVGLPAHWLRTDEWYNYKELQADNRTIVSLDESSYSGGTHGAIHPLSWYREFEGGRVFYTGMGHTAGTYSEPLFQLHIKAAINWLLRR
jgi:type 1 glutamine amidotransferase